MTAPPSTEELLVQVLVRSLDARVAVETGGETASDRDAADQELDLAFAQVWRRVGRLEIRCDSDGLQWDGRLVLRPEEARSPLLATTLSSGIHTLILEPGCEGSEIARLAEMVAARAASDDVDLVMMLFAEELPHVGYSLGSAGPAGDGTHVAQDRKGSPGTEDGPRTGGAPSAERRASDAEPARPALQAEALRTAVRQEAATSDDRGIVRLDDFDSTLYFLDDREVEYLRSEIDRQYTHDQTRSVLALLLDTFQLVEDDEVREEVLGVLRSLLPYLLGSGRFTALAYLTEEARRTLGSTELAADHRQALQSIRQSVSERGALTQIFLGLEEGTLAASPTGLRTLLGELDGKALETTLVWAGQLQRPEAKQTLYRALEEHFGAAPDALVRILQSRDRVAVRRALGLAGGLRLPELVDGVGAALALDDAATRKLAVEVLSAIGGTPAMRLVAGALGDPDTEVRKAVYQAFLVRPYRSIAKALRRVLESTDLESVDLSERKLLFSAFGAAVGAEGVAELEPLVAGRKTFGGKPSSETRACAVLALGRIDTPAARTALEAAVGYRDPLVRSAAASTLRERNA